MTEKSTLLVKLGVGNRKKECYDKRELKKEVLAMIFHPKSEQTQPGRFLLPEVACALCHPCLEKGILQELWQNFSLGTSQLLLRKAEGFSFLLGEAEALPLGGEEYTINITPHGICLAAEGEQGLLRGFMTLLDRLEWGEEGAFASCCQIRDRGVLANRMVHLCIFPETQLWQVERFIRFAGALRYTHLVLEFWGMLRYDCMQELAWPCAFTKEELRPLIALAKDLGLEVIPMFNHWGHATQSRVLHGKHVVLDQNPRLQEYFSPDGWCWDIRKEKVRQLLGQIRKELCDLCGPGGYFHIGCDEAYSFDLSLEENRVAICRYINEVAEALRGEGRETILWGDMFLFHHPHYDESNRYTCSSPSAECEAQMLGMLDKRLILADWQYDVKHYPVETASVFAKAGFRCLLCPWDRGVAAVNACLQTAKRQGLFGVMHTTWHTLSAGMPYVLLSALQGLEEERSLRDPQARTHAAALLRRVYPSGGVYERAGFSERQVGFLW